jgi:hypothetical protein
MSFIEIFGKTEFGPIAVAFIEKLSAGIAAVTNMARLDSIGLVRFTTPWITESGRFYKSRAIRVRYFGDERRFQLAEMEKQPGHYYFYYGSVRFHAPWRGTLQAGVSADLKVR